MGFTVSPTPSPKLWEAPQRGGQGADLEAEASNFGLTESGSPGQVELLVRGIFGV